MAISDPKTAMLGLNHSLSSSTNPTAEKNANIIDGNLIVKSVTPKTAMLVFCNKWYGRFVVPTVVILVLVMASLLTTDCISESDMPPGRYSPANTKAAINASATRP